MNKIDTKLKDIKIKDLLFVILYGALLSMLFGVVIGFVDYYLLKVIPFSFAGLLFFMSAMYIGKNVRRQYVYPHIVYTIITGLFLLIQAMIMLSWPGLLYFAIETGNIIEAINPWTYIRLFFQLFISLFTNFSFDYILFVLFISVGIYVGVSKTY